MPGLCARFHRRHKFPVKVQFFCNVQQRTLYQVLKISLKFQKYAISNKIIQNGRPSRSLKSKKKDEKVPKKPRNPRKTLESPEDSVRDPRRAENCQKNAVLCHLAQENAPEERRIFSKVPKPRNEGTQKTLKTWMQTWNMTNSSLF